VFAHDWERAVFGLTFATLAQGLYNTDENRYARETMDPAEYLASSYWALWFGALETNLDDKQVVTLAETDARVRAITNGDVVPGTPPPRPEIFEAVDEAVLGGVSPARPLDRPPRYAIGSSVRARHENPPGHTRLPGYVLGRAGLVTRVCGSYVLPDANAHLRGESPEHVYTVRFAASDLWGERGEANTVVYVDTWESYLEPITAGEGRMHGRA